MGFFGQAIYALRVNYRLAYLGVPTLDLIPSDKRQAIQVLGYSTGMTPEEAAAFLVLGMGVGWQPDGWEDACALWIIQGKVRKGICLELDAAFYATFEEAAHQRRSVLTRLSGY